MSYAFGIGTERNEVQALKLLKQVADKDPSSIKIVYDLDDDVTEIYSSAEELIAAVQFMIGRLYFEGKDTNKDYVQAEIWLKKAAEHGSKHVKEEILEALRILKAQSSSSTTTSQPQPLTSGNVIEIGIEQLLQNYKDNKMDNDTLLF